ncbi:hypothetical protein D3C81_985840 [compost metagenome]
MRLDDGDMDVRQYAPQILAGSGDGAARACRGYEPVEPAIHLPHDFWPCREPVNFRVGRVLKLLRHKTVGDLVQQLPGFGDCAGHALRSRRQHDLGPVSLQQGDSLLRHIVRHDEDNPIPFGRGVHRQPDARIPARRLDDRGPRSNQTGLFCLCKHVGSGSILNASARIGKLQLDVYVRLLVGDQFV